VDFTTADLCDAFPRAVQLAEPLFREYGAVAKFAGAVETLSAFPPDTFFTRMVTAFC
jgi:regulator of RNase E activity RraA